MPDTIRHRPRSIFRIGAANEFAQSASQGVPKARASLAGPRACFPGKC